MAINPSQFLSSAITRSVGAVGTGLILADAHHAAKEHAHMYETKKTTESLQERYFDTLKLETPSKVRDTVKKRIFEFDMDNNIDSFFYSIAGYAKGMGEMLVNNVVPFALSLGAMLGPKGLISKTCGIGLAAYGLGFLAQEVFRIGK